jgi:hypothetical protein
VDFKTAINQNLGRQKQEEVEKVEVKVEGGAKKPPVPTGKQGFRAMKCMMGYGPTLAKAGWGVLPEKAAEEVQENLRSQIEDVQKQRSEICNGGLEGVNPIDNLPQNLTRTLYASEMSRAAFEIQKELLRASCILMGAEFDEDGDPTGEFHLSKVTDLPETIQEAVTSIQACIAQLITIAAYSGTQMRLDPTVPDSAPVDNEELFCLVGKLFGSLPLSAGVMDVFNRISEAVNTDVVAQASGMLGVVRAACRDSSLLPGLDGKHHSREEKHPELIKLIESMIDEDATLTRLTDAIFDEVRSAIDAGGSPEDILARLKEQWNVKDEDNKD